MSRCVEAYVKCPLVACMKREAQRRGGAFHAPRDIYKKALTSKSKTVPEVGVPYEESENPVVTVDSDKISAEEFAEKILDIIMRRFRDASSLPLGG